MYDGGNFNFCMASRRSPNNDTVIDGPRATPTEDLEEFITISSSCGKGK